MWPRFLIELVFVSLLVLSLRVTGQADDPPPPPPIEKLAAEEFRRRMQEDEFDVVADVRNKATEWDLGHIEGATLVEALASFGTDQQVSTPEDLAGCEHCTIAVYCRSGARASRALEILRSEGFVGPLYNGQGIVQWLEAGFVLVNTTEEYGVVPPCTEDNTTCPAYSNATANTTTLPYNNASMILQPSPAPSVSASPTPSETLVGNTSMVSSMNDASDNSAAAGVAGGGTRWQHTAGMATSALVMLQLIVGVSGWC